MARALPAQGDDIGDGDLGLSGFEHVHTPRLGFGVAILTEVLRHFENLQRVCQNIKLLTHCNINLILHRNILRDAVLQSSFWWSFAGAFRPGFFIFYL